MTRARWLVFVVGVALALAWGLTHRRAAPPRDAGWGSDATLPSASAHRDDGTIMPLDVKAGDRVLFGKWSGTEVKIDGEDRLIMKESDLLGVIVKTAKKAKK